MASDYCRKIIILGKTGSGKSSLGNSLLGTCAFKVGHNLITETERCQKRSENNLCVVDTPGLLDVENHVADAALEILSSLNKSPKPHAFLIVFSALARTGHDELRTISLLRLIFTENILNHAIVVFTGYDDKATDSDFDKFWKGNVMIRAFVEACGGRVARIDNKGESSDLSKRVREILQYVDILCENGQRRFDSTFKSVNEHALQNIQRENATLARKSLHHQQHSIETFEQELQQIRIALSRDYHTGFKSSTKEEKRKIAKVLFGIGCVAAGAILIKRGENPDLDVVTDAVTSAVSSERAASWSSSIIKELQVILTDVILPKVVEEEDMVRHIDILMAAINSFC